MSSVRNVEMVEGKRIVCYDDGGKTADRYTVVYADSPESRPGMYEAVGMSAEPFHPQGVGQHCSAMPGAHLGRRIAFEALPQDCRTLVLRDLKAPEVVAEVEVEDTRGQGR